MLVTIKKKKREKKEKTEKKKKRKKRAHSEFGIPGITVEAAIETARFRSCWKLLLLLQLPYRVVLTRQYL